MTNLQTFYLAADSFFLGALSVFTLWRFLDGRPWKQTALAAGFFAFLLVNDFWRA